MIKINTIAQSLLSVVMIATISQSTLAQSTTCRSGEYVLSLSNISPKRERAVDVFENALQDVAGDSAAAIVADQTTSSLLVVNQDENASTAVDADDANAACRALRHNARQDLLAARESGLNELAAKRERFISCSCNVILNQYAQPPSDPLFSYQWHLAANTTTINNNDVAGMWRANHTAAPSVVVAITDSGVEYDHADLAQNMWRNTAEIAANGIDDDHNGYIDDIYGARIVANVKGGDPRDDNGHGTHCAGIIGARANNGIGLSGVLWDTKMMAVKFLDSHGSGDLFDGVAALDYILAQRNRGVNVRVVNASWGAGVYIQPLYDAIARLNSAGVMFVAAAGNAGQNNDTSLAYPANYALPNVISVMAMDQNGRVTPWSNYGYSHDEVMAPGDNIGSTYIGGAYKYMSGTSMAAPQISAIIAAGFEYKPNASVAQMRAALLATTNEPFDNYGVCPLNQFGRDCKLVRAPLLFSALDGAPPPAPVISPTAAPTMQPTVAPTQPAPTPQPTATAQPGPVTITGTISDSSSYGQTQFPKLVAGARIVFTWSGGTIVRYSSASGKFSLPAVLSGGTYTITISRAGFEEQRLTGNLTNNLNLQVVSRRKTYSISGRVMLGDQTPLAGVTVMDENIGATATDSQGRFELRAPYGYHYDLDASRMGLAFKGVRLSGSVEGDVERVFVAQEVSEAAED